MNRKMKMREKGIRVLCAGLIGWASLTGGLPGARAGEVFLDPVTQAPVAVKSVEEKTPQITAAPQTLALPELAGMDQPLAPAVVQAPLGPVEGRSTHTLHPLPSKTLNGKLYPAAATVAPSGATAQANDVNRGGYLFFNTGQAGWAGGGLTFDDFMTSTIETTDLSSLSHLDFGLQGSLTNVKMEVVDMAGNKASVQLTGIRNDIEQVWSVPKTALSGGSVVWSQVRLIYFIVEGQGQTGSLNYFHYPPYSSNAALANYFDTSSITPLPGSPQKTFVSPTGTQSTGSDTARGIVMNYATGAHSWAGGGFTYDNFSTPAIETQDISRFEYLVFGLKGTPGHVKLEVIDEQNRKTNIYFRGVRSDAEQVWLVETKAIASYGVDLKKIRLIYFIIEGQQQTGQLEINRIPTPLVPSTIHAVQNIGIPGEPAMVPLQPAGTIASVADSGRGGFRLDFNTGRTGWTGAGFSYDNFSTPAIEVGNWSVFSPVVIGLRGTVPQVKVEIIDDLGNKAVFQITGIHPDQDKVWAFSTPAIRNLGVNISRIRMVYFIVEGANRTGALEVRRKYEAGYGAIPVRYTTSVILTQRIGTQYFPVPEIAVEIRDQITGQVTLRRITGGETGNPSAVRVLGVSPDGNFVIISYNNNLYVAGPDTTIRARRVGSLTAPLTVNFLNPLEALLKYSNSQLRLNVSTLAVS